jgi:hypothetical protein
MTSSGVNPTMRQISPASGNRSLPIHPKAIPL